MSVYETERVALFNADCLEALKLLPDNSVDACVTDPPYGLSKEPDVAEVLRKWLAGEDYQHRGGGFMGKSWDSFVPGPSVWREVFRVLKPGAHLLVFAGTRTEDLMGMSVRLAGFERRDTFAWLFSQGFPKSLSVHKATQLAVESSYGTSRCDCLDARDGRSYRDGVGCEGRSPTRHSGGSGQVQAAGLGPTGVSAVSGTPSGPVCELREGGGAQEPGREAQQETLLLADVRGRGPEDARLGDVAVRSRMEEHESADPATRPFVPSVRSSAGAGCAPRSPSEAVQGRGDEQAGKPGGTVRLMPPHNRGGHDLGAGLDPDRRESRRLHLDDHGGRRSAVARVCSWCGLPAQEWLDSLEPLGTALKPAHEPILVFRKPLAGTVAANVLEHGTGALNIDGCRVKLDEGESTRRSNTAEMGYHGGNIAESYQTGSDSGRWPANVLLDEEAADLLDAQTGTLKSGVKQPEGRGDGLSRGGWRFKEGEACYADSGGASRFFYVAKASRSEREAGCEHLTGRTGAEAVDRTEGSAGLNNPRAGAGCTAKQVKNHHPTVKPVALMRWLVRLVAPPGGVVLDPYTGSGTTGIASLHEGFSFVGMEADTEHGYIHIARARLERAEFGAPAPAGEEDAA